VRARFRAGLPRTRTAAELAARLRAADADHPGAWGPIGLLPVNALLVPLALAAGGA
jgi:hypothetical protein